MPEKRGSRDADQCQHTYPGGASVEISAAVRKAIERNERAWMDFKDGEDGAENFLVGQVMHITGGEANPAEVIEELRSVDADGGNDER